MGHEEFRALTAAYALSALDADELKKFEAHLATCPDCRAGVAEMQPIVDALSIMNQESQPSGQLRERILESAKAEPNITNPSHPEKRRYSAPRWRKPVL